MTKPQMAVCAEGETFAIFITLTLKEGEDAAATVRAISGQLLSLTQGVAERQSVPTLCSAIGFGAGVWQTLFGNPAPSQLVPFAEIIDGPRRAPATPADLFLHIHSTHHEANFTLARAVMDALRGAVTVVEEVHGFRNFQGRDLTGFIDGTENPVGDERREVALVGDEDEAFAGGSYVSIQRYVHALPKWERLPVADQEAAVGRTKADDAELDDTVKPPSAHIARVVIEEDGEELAIVRHSLPYGSSSQNGLYFVAYGGSPVPFRKMLERMVIADDNGVYDRLLDFTTPVTGAAFFVPAIDFLLAHP